MKTETWIFICSEFDLNGQGEVFESWLETNYNFAYNWFLANK